MGEKECAPYDEEGYPTYDLYHDNKLLRDTSTSKSEYYSNTIYYEDEHLNNYSLANFDIVNKKSSFDEIKKSSIKIDDLNELGNKSSDVHITSGGTSYYYDDEGKIHNVGDEFETKPAEKYGPMKYEE